MYDRNKETMLFQAGAINGAAGMVRGFIEADNLQAAKDSLRDIESIASKLKSNINQIEGK
jgi:hypothetical protein